jgi:hypothetical protein
MSTGMSTTTILGLVVGLLIVIALIVGIVVVVVRLASKPSSPSGQQAVMPPVTAPGWYPDQNDPNLVRYFDGRIWTSSTQPRRG